MISTTGTVVKGQQLGRKIGFPTLNLSGWCLPDYLDFGVYGCSVRIGERMYQGIVHYGLKGPKYEVVVLEVHVFDFAADVYGQEVVVEFGVFVRPPKNFAKLEALQQQIVNDIEFVRGA